MEENIKNIILLGENVNTELKQATNGLPKSVFESVCSFLNTTGGYIILGVNDKKEIIGIKEELIEKIKKDYTTQCNNKGVISPTILSELHEIKIEGKIILYTYIEEATEIHKCKGKVFVRNYEGDFDISNNIPLIASIHNKKRKIFDEDTIYPYVSVEEDLRHDLIEKARRVSPRNVMVREIVLNTLMHRDITDGHTSRVIIYKDKLICENPNSFSTNGLLTIKNYTPFAKNPTIAKFFREIGYADELGSGFIKITKNSYLYSGKPPIFEDKEMFRVTIPLLRDEKLDEKDLINLANGTLNGTLNLILNELKNKNNITQQELSEKTGMSLRTIKRNIDMLKEERFIERVGSKKTGHWKILKND